jgi:hypothetical protein
MQSVSPVAHAPHCPLVHVVPVGQRMPQPPQLLTSVPVVAQYCIVPLPHET